MIPKVWYTESMQLKEYTTQDIEGKRILVRCDLDVKVNEEGYVDSYHDLRLERIVPTVHDLFQHGAKQVILCGHRGRPTSTEDTQFSLAPVCDRLSDLCFADGIDEHIQFIEDIYVESYTYQDAPIIMLENLRFWKGEKEHDSSFAERLKQWGDVYVNDAFGNSHRDHSSMVLVPQLFGEAYAGTELNTEVDQLFNFLSHVKKPYVAILGGAKVSTKLPLIASLLDHADHIIVGGGIANTFLAAQGHTIGNSLHEPELIAQAKKLLSPKMILPTDVVLENKEVVSVQNIPKDGSVFDIGMETQKHIGEIVSEAETIFWNGPMGKFEDVYFNAGTHAVAHACARNTQARTLAGGGETVEVLERLSLIDQYDFVSTGGGAMLTFLAGETMPALDILSI